MGQCNELHGQCDAGGRPSTDRPGSAPTGMNRHICLRGVAELHADFTPAD